MLHNLEVSEEKLIAGKPAAKSKTSLITNNTFFQD